MSAVRSRQRPPYLSCLNTEHFIEFEVYNNLKVSRRWEIHISARQRPNLKLHTTLNTFINSILNRLSRMPVFLRFIRMAGLCVRPLLDSVHLLAGTVKVWLVC